MASSSLGPIGWALPWENYQSYWALAAQPDGLKTPTWWWSAARITTPVSEAEQLYSALKLKGVPTMLVKVPNASHGGIAARPSQSAAKAAITAWFDKYRKTEGTAQMTERSGN
jgi:hypothetical protein